MRQSTHKTHKQQISIGSARQQGGASRDMHNTTKQQKKTAYLSLLSGSRTLSTFSFIEKRLKLAFSIKGLFSIFSPLATFTGRTTVAPHVLLLLNSLCLSVLFPLVVRSSLTLHACPRVRLSQSWKNCFIAEIVRRSRGYSRILNPMNTVGQYMVASTPITFVFIRI